MTPDLDVGLEKTHDQSTTRYCECIGRDFRVHEQDQERARMTGDSRTMAFASNNLSGQRWQSVGEMEKSSADDDDKKKVLTSNSGM